MADLIGPFSGTAPWSEGEWYNFAPTWAPSGIIGTPASSVSTGDFAVTASGLSLTVACAGDRAWLDGSGYKPDTNKTNTVTANAHASWSRRDRLVIRRDLAAKTITVARLTGTAAATPVAPSLTQTTGGVWELPICSFLVPPVSGTTLSDFVDERAWVDPAGGRRLPSSWTTLGTPGDSTYSQGADGTWTNLSGMSGSILAPSGATVEVEFEATTVAVAVNGSVYLRLVADGVLLGRAQQFSTDSTGTLAAPARLAAEFTSTGAPVAVAAQVSSSVGGGYVQGGFATNGSGQAVGGGVHLHYRIR